MSEQSRSKILSNTAQVMLKAGVVGYYLTEQK